MQTMSRTIGENLMMTQSEIALRRLHSQRLLTPAFGDPAEVVRWFGAVQAQEFLASLWGLAQRLPPTTEAAVEQAVAERRILRTWPMRGTVHFVPAEDTRWMVELMATRVIGRFQSYHRQLGLDEAVFARARGIFERALAGGQPMKRTDLYALLKADGIETGNMRGMFIAGKLAHDALICSGPRIGKQPTFVWLAAWAPTQRALGHDEGVVEMARRYFRSHGPATIQDFRWWTGLLAADARAGLDAIKGELVEETVDGKTYWWVDEALPEFDPDAVYLLPPFDEYLVAYTDRSASLDRTRKVDWPRVDALGSYIIVIGGQVVGYWQRTTKKNVASITYATFRPLDTTEQTRLEAAFERYGAFLGLPVVLA